MWVKFLAQVNKDMSRVVRMRDQTSYCPITIKSLAILQLYYTQEIITTLMFPLVEQTACRSLVLHNPSPINKLANKKEIPAITDLC